MLTYTQCTILNDITPHDSRLLEVPVYYISELTHDVYNVIITNQVAFKYRAAGNIEVQVSDVVFVALR